MVKVLLNIFFTTYQFYDLQKEQISTYTAVLHYQGSELCAEVPEIWDQCIYTEYGNGIGRPRGMKEVIMITGGEGEMDDPDGQLQIYLFMVGLAQWRSYITSLITLQFILTKLSLFQSIQFKEQRGQYAELLCQTQGLCLLIPFSFQTQLTSFFRQIKILYVQLIIVI